ncbi:hypothetical protein Tco_0721823 [Tanacetum coccineum]
MAQENYVEGCSVKRPPLLEPNGFCVWKARFETYVKSKDINLWQVIQNGDFYYEVKHSETKLMKETPYELLEDDKKKKLGKKNEAKMTLYNALPRKEYERVFMCKTAKEVWHTLVITHQGISQVKNCKIDLLTQEYEKFSISNEETIDNGFTRFNAIVTSLKSLDLDYSSKNNVYEMVLDNDGVASKTTKEKVCLKCDLRPDDWIVDSSYTNHMTGNRRLFTSYKAYDSGHVVFGSNLKGKVVGGGNITHDSITITNVEHVSGLAFNLITIGYSQTSKAYIVLNNETMIIEESLNVTFDESLPEPKSSPKSVKEARGHPIEQVIGIPLKSWEKNQLYPYLKAWADVLLSNVFVEIVAQESLPIIVGYMLYCIKTNTPFNFAYFIARRLSGLDYNNEALPFSRIMTTLFKYLKNKHPNDAS